MANPTIKIKADIQSANVIMVALMNGTFKEVKNYNKILDSAEFSTAYFEVEEDSPILDYYQVGNFVLIDDVVKYIISTVKKTRSGKTNFWKADVVCVSLAYILQKIVLPNKSFRQRINVPLNQLRKVGEVIVDLVDVYFKQFRGYECMVDISTDAVANEFTWTAPTLYEAICDLVEGSNLVPYLEYINGFVLKFKNIATLGSEYAYKDTINGQEQNGDIEFQPQKMINTVVNNLSNGVIKENGLFAKNNIGLLVDDNESNYYQTACPINEIKRVIVEGYLSADLLNSIVAGYYAFDLTDFVIVKEVFDTLLIDKKGKPDNATDDNFRNCYLYFEKNKPNIYGAFLTYKNWLGITKNTNLTYILNYIIKYLPDVLIEKPSEASSSMNITPLLTNLFSLKVEYKTLDTVRFDFNKDGAVGFGELVQNQTSAFINFKAYRGQQQDIFSRLGAEEEVSMGRVYNQLHLPENGMLNNGKLIVQTITIPSRDFVDYMFISTSAFNRIDGDAVINTKKRYTTILAPSESIERHEYKEITANNYYFDIIKRQYYEASGVNFSKVFIKAVSDLRVEAPKSVLLNYLVQEVDADTLLITVKAENNHYAGVKIVEDEGSILMEGVPYTDKNGEAQKITFNFCYVELQTGANLAVLKDIPAIPLANIYDLTTPSVEAFYNKDNGERIALSILVKRN